MTILNAIELIQQHHPNLSEVQILQLINKAADTLAEDANMITEIFSDVSPGTVAGQRYYDLPVGVTSVDRVILTDSEGEYYKIPRITSIPMQEDKDVV